MGYDDETLAFVHDGVRDQMAITIFGSLKSIPSMKRIPSRIPISVSNPYHHEQDRGIEYPTRDKDRQPFAQEVDLRYLKNIKSITNRIKSSYSCNQELCPMIKERMEHHQVERHSSSSKSQGCCCRERDIDSQTVILPTSSRHHNSRTGPDSTDTQPIQTNINNTSNEMKHNNEYSFNNNSTYLRPNSYGYSNNKTDKLRHNNHNCNYGENFKQSATNYDFDNNLSDDNIPLKRTETRSVVTPKRNIYKDFVKKEVREWFQEVPIYPNLGQDSSFSKDNIINDLTDEINHLLNGTNTEAYDKRIKLVIDRSLNSVPMWYPGAKRDQENFKKILNDNLLIRIKDLNKKLTNTSNNNTEKYNSFSNRNSLSNLEELEEEVNDWLSMINSRKSSGMQMNVDRKEIIEALLNRVVPVLMKSKNSCHYTIRLKSAIVEVLNDLPIDSRCSKNRNIHLHRFAEDLANRLLSIRAKAENGTIYPNSHQTMYQTSDSFYQNDKKYFENIIHREINKCLANTRFAHYDDMKTEISNSIMDYVDSPVPVEEFDVNKEIIDVLKSASKIPIFLASNIAKNIIREVKSALNEGNYGVPNIKPTITRKISVYASEEKCCSQNYPVTSTPNKNKLESVSKLNSEEIEYAQNVGKLIRAWMETLPEQFNGPDEKEFKETIIKDLAGEITDEAKLEQLASVDEKEKWLKYLVYKWLHKLDVFDLEEVGPQIEDLLKRVKDIHVPVLIRPQHGNRQAMANIQHMESELGWKEYFVPKGKDILEDEISIWINEQPPSIFDTDKTARSIKIHELAEVLQNKLKNKRPEKEMTNDVAQWLTKIVKPDQNAKVGELAHNLRGRLVNLPQDATLAANRDEKLRQRAEHLKAKMNPYSQPDKIKTNDETVILNKTMQQFIVKFIEHNYDIDDPMARGAFSYLLKTKLQRLNPPTRKEVYDNFAKSESINQLSRNKLNKELDYIKDISDWLKNIPIDAHYNAVGNIERIDFVTDLARNILEVEEHREDNPEAMDYNMYMASIISQFLVQLPLIEEHRNDKNMMFMIDQLVGKVIVHQYKKPKADNSIDTSGVHSDNIGDFIEEFIRVHGSEIAEDEVKVDAWSARLLDEIKKMVRENTDPTALSKAQVYNRLTNVPIPADESIKQFDDEIEYIKEISEWLKNLPLLPIDKADEQERIRMICELTEKITERESKKSNNPNNDKTDAELAEYISKWISDLSLDESHEVVVSVVIKQLVNRIERVKNKSEKTGLDLTKDNENTQQSIETNLSKKLSSKIMKAKNKKIKNPASAIVDAIEKWSASLPIKLDDEKTVKSLKDDASKKLFQKVGELSIDPRTFNDDLLYQEILTDEIDAVIEKLPQSPDLQNNKEKLTNNLVEQIIEAQKAIKENCAGEFYKQKLEHTIEASIPHPVNAKRAYDPGFEIYKSRLANLFILENFDHANNAVKIKYERRIKDEIDKYYDSAKNKNAIPLTKDEIYNELYSALFKVSIPKESSIIGEVEEIKTRCEIDAWFEQLPLKEEDDITELLERDKILATLAKRIHEIEKAGSKTADKIQKEIVKWVVKLPLIAGEESNAEQFANKLRDTLKLSADERKFNMTAEPSSKSKKGKTKVKSKEKIKVDKEDSQTPGPSTDGKNRESKTEPVKFKKKAAELIIEIVEAWCNQLPVYATTPEEEETAKMIRDNLSTKIIIKISELNMNPDTFNDDFQFNDLLDEELDILLADIPTCCDFKESKAARKVQLKDAIKSVKPLFIEEKARYQYKQDLNITVAKVLGKEQDTTAEKEALLKDLKEEMVDNFILFNYDKDEDEGRQAYKIKVHDSVVKFLANLVDNKAQTASNSLMRRNQLLCELAKIPVPGNESLKEEVEEIRMKNEISELFDELSISVKGQVKIKLINQVKSSLAKKLNDIELNGYNSNTETKMKQEVAKSMKKVSKEVKQDVIGDFVNKLKNNERIRRAPRKIKTNISSGKDFKKIVNETPVQEESSRNNVNQNSSKNSKEKKNYLEYRQNLQRSSDNSQTNADSSSTPESKTEVGCDRLTNFPQRERPDYSENEISPPYNIDEEERCICGGLKSIRPCFMPMRWFCTGPEDKPICRMPAGFYYY